MEARCCHSGHNIISWCYFYVHKFYIVSLQVFENALSPNGEEPPLWRHVVVTMVITLLVGAISMSTNCILFLCRCLKMLYLLMGRNHLYGGTLLSQWS